MDDGKTYIPPTDRILLLTLEKKDTKGWHNYPSVRKRSGSSLLPNNGNVGDRRKQAKVEGIIAKLTNVAEDNNTRNNVEINEESPENNVVDNITNNGKIDKDLLEKYEGDNVPESADQGVTVQVSSVVNENIVHENRAVDENNDDNNGSTTGESSDDDENSGRNNGPTEMPETPPRSTDYVETNHTPDVKCEYLNNGSVIGIVEICSESKPGLIVHGKPLSDVEVMVKVIEKYGSTDDKDVEEFYPGSFLVLTKVKLRKITKTQIGVKRLGRGSKIGASPNKWSNKRRKLSRNSGRGYENVRGELVLPKELKEKPCKVCRFTSCADVTEMERREVFVKFYNSGMTFDEQNVVILQNVKITTKKVSKNVKPGVTSRPKQVSRKYFINGKNVCKELFLATYSIANGRLQRLLQKVQQNPNAVPKDGRGNQRNHEILNKDVYQILTDVIQRLPKYISHYSREKHDNNILYLQPGSVITSSGKKKDTSLFHLLKEECEENGVEPPKKTWF